jgi:ATPase family associated with various cellular activities (AAA)
VLEAAAAQELRQALEGLERLVARRLRERGRSANGDALGVTELAVRPLGADEADELPPPPLGDGPLGRLVEAYDLDAAETLTVVAALAPEVDEKFDVLYAYLDDRGGSRGLTGEVLRTLVSGSFAGRIGAADLVAPGGKLRGLRLLTLEAGAETMLAGRVRLNPELAPWLLGRQEYEPELSTEFPAQRLRTVHGFDDLVLPPDVSGRLRLVLERIRHRRSVVDVWGFGRRHDNVEGFHILFHGPPGTGKTMAAAVLGREAGLAVYRIDLASVVSKYIGETEKNLAGIFDRAEARDWILFFDEADALFGRRAEVQDARDRYANQEVSYLLQRLESFAGVTILATNVLRNVDDAFLRRLHAQVSFPEPSLQERTVLWRSVTPPELPLADDVDLDRLSEDFALTGGEIRNAVFHAAYRAYADGGRVTDEHLREGVKTEYEKTGRLVPPPGHG